MKSKVIGIIMTYNCAHLLEEACKKLPQGVFDEFIIVDDGSKDNIEEVAKKLPYPFFKHEHIGYGGNLRYGLQKAMEMGADAYLVKPVNTDELLRTIKFVCSPDSEGSQTPSQ